MTKLPLRLSATCSFAAPADHHAHPDHEFLHSVPPSHLGPGENKPKEESNEGEEASPRDLGERPPPKMHDFCFTIPYGFAVLAGGVLGYLRRGSTASLAGGAGAGALLLLAGFVSLKAFEKRRNSYLALALETLCALALTYVMGQRYLETSKIMPAGVVAGLSAVMSAFYLFKIATGGNHIPPKKE
ncbi:Protein FATTY ACID EXPORT 5 [Dichanthelium oligosanthes]|uniref:Protein FATTY ACID EXPORT 5 n=1 Tax=Dichanthelium oligosanthes TaxID=888268 RepID=A0A1E5VQZ7_9POAL|nr:Protein FATTY ACID EXPORT 5 [Dichanthelium oligosanthes]